MKFLLVILLFSILLTVTITEPITIGVISTVFGIGVLYRDKILCSFKECCQSNSQWLPMNMTKLEEDLTKHLYGQPLVQFVLMKILKNHIMDNNPPKALLLSFNGMTGTGKNFVSKMIANSLFKKGVHSKFFHFYLSGTDFPIAKYVDEYKMKLQEEIKDAVKNCPRSVFVFDEVHDMPVTLLDAIKPFVDNHESIYGVDYRKSIFILLSNSGGKDINTKLVNINREGRSRESLTLHEMEEVLVKNLFVMKNDGLRKSKLITHNLITAFVPFLPLEKEHVKLCIKAYLRQKGHNEDHGVIEQVLGMVNFNLQDGLYLALQGCKKVADKVQLVI